MLPRDPTARICANSLPIRFRDNFACRDILPPRLSLGRAWVRQMTSLRWLQLPAERAYQRANLGHLRVGVIIISADDENQLPRGRPLSTDDQFRLPGVDFAALLDRDGKHRISRKANRIVFRGLAVASLSATEILQETMKEGVCHAGQQDAIKKLRISPRGFSKEPANMRELADMATKSQREASIWFARGSEENWKHPKLWKKAGNEMPFDKCNQRSRSAELAVLDC